MRACIAVVVLASCTDATDDQRKVKVGILHSLSGTMATSERSVVDATLMAIDELNAAGGLLGATLIPVIADGRSDDLVFAQEAKRLITEEHVAVVFGVWTSASRRAVKPVFERYQHLLVYPVQYEGLEQSDSILYTGAAPNQQVLPAVGWALANLGKRVYLVGSDYVFPRAANEIMKDQIHALGGEVVGERYIMLGSKDVQSVVDEIVLARPSVILNTINGDSNKAFFQALRAAGITPAVVPTLSFSIAENELSAWGHTAMVGDYAAWNYFQSIDSQVNRAFVDNFQRRYGRERVVSDPMEAAYFGVYLWAQAVVDAGSTKPVAVRRALQDQSRLAPGGVVYVDPETNHVWKTVRIGQVRPDGQFDIVWSSDYPIRPTPYPSYRLLDEWNQFVQGLYRGWNEQWSNPGM